MLLAGNGQSYGTHNLSGGAVRRARKRCKHHRQPRVGGFCRECFLAELEEAIAEEHPELDHGEVFELVQEWLRAVDQAVH